MLLYLFIWRIVRSASRDFRTGPAAESVIMSPTDAAALGLAPVRRAQLVVLKSPALDVGEEVPVDSMPVAVGRGGQNEVPLDGDEFASAQHARFESRRDGLWVEDIGSTNGTFVNGARVTTPRRLSQGRRRPRRPDRLQGGGLMLGRSAVVSDTGRRRRRNEDQYVCEPPLFAVADGMGGAQAGEVASGLAAAVLERGRQATERGEERVGVADPGGEPARLPALERGRSHLRAWARR